ncbi:hypothetical protein QE152_g8850 [Popillia japonica]|uniref:Uncharacterized protein n=1 Tax=Popillia japonica TaxID=7064 RepID=A0AAW1M0L1_POPJA
MSTESSETKEDTKNVEDEKKGEDVNKIMIIDEEIVPLRNVRRKSVTRMLKPGEYDAGAYSPANSITSVNSLASLLREKIQVGDIYFYYLDY